MTYWNFINSRIRQFTVTLAPSDGFMSLNLRKLTFWSKQIAEINESVQRVQQTVEKNAVGSH
jgi:hypothetical protein